MWNLFIFGEIKIIWFDLIWGEQTAALSQRATAIRRDESSILVPNEAQGRAFRNAPENGAAAAIKRAFPLDQVQFAERVLW